LFRSRHACLDGPQRSRETGDVKTYSMNELTELTKLSARTVRQYIALNLIDKPTLAGSATRYSRETLGKLLAIRAWRFDERITTHGIRRALREWPEGEAEAWAEEVDPIAPPPAPPAKVVGAAPAAHAPVVVAPATAAHPGGAPGDALGEKWHHVPLMPGLMLLMREGAGEMTASVAREIQTRYRVG
jgi:DNA-binding transcriptional MerR regulator